MHPSIYFKAVALNFYYSLENFSFSSCITIICRPNQIGVLYRCSQ